MIPAGLTCATCHGEFLGRLARRTKRGWVHSGRCPIASPAVLTGRWVRVGNVNRYISTEETA